MSCLGLVLRMKLDDGQREPQSGDARFGRLVVDRAELRRSAWPAQRRTHRASMQQEPVEHARVHLIRLDRYGRLVPEHDLARCRSVGREEPELSADKDHRRTASR